MTKRLILNQKKARALTVPQPERGLERVGPLHVAPMPVGEGHIMPQEAPGWPRSQGSGPTWLPARQNEGRPLSELILIGRQFHGLAREAYTQKVVRGYYAYEASHEWRTCALAAATAALLGPQYVERDDWSLSEATWLLSQALGYDLRVQKAPGPWGGAVIIRDELMRLVDREEWSRRAVALWLMQVGY